MKKRYLKKWVEYSIIFIQFILIMILSADSDNLKVFIISKIIALLIFYINHLILKNYILENTFISKELYEKNERSQFYLTAQELFHYGIIDEIIDEVKMPSICKKCLLRRECENCIDYAYENVTDNFSCEDFEPDV